MNRTIIGCNKRVPKPDKTPEKLLDLAGVKLPRIPPLVKNETNETNGKNRENEKNVDTETKLQNRRK